MKIVVDERVPYLQGVLEAEADVHYLPAAAITREEVRDADALVVRTRTRCTRELLEGSAVRLVATATIGTDHIDLDWCARQGIEVVSAPGCNAPAVAQWVLASMGVWMKKRGLAATHDITVGIVGVGHVGSIVARWAQECGFKILLNDPPRAGREGNDRFVALKDVLAQCDVLTLHTPLTTRGPWPTWHLMNDETMQSMPRCRLLLNAARGGIVDETALLSWQGDLAIDCWETEPRPNATLLRRALVATPHIAGYSSQGKARASAMMITALNRHYGWRLPVPRIEEPATGAAGVTLEAIMRSYDPLADTDLLRGRPESFEQLRNQYCLRQELK